MVRQEQPNYPIITDGTGAQGRLIDYKDIGPDKDGINKIKLWIWPTEETLDKYNIPREVLDNYLLVKTYPIVYFRFIDRSPGYAACDLLCTFEGKPSPRMEDSDHDKNTIVSLQNQIRHKDNEIAYLKEKLKKEEFEIEKYLKQIDTLVKMFSKKEKDDDEYGYQPPK